MSYFIVRNNNNNIKGIFNTIDNIPTKYSEFVYKLPKNKKKINDNDTIYLFFQNLNGSISNLTIFNTKKKAENFRENNNSYGYILGLKPNLIYKTLLEYEYLSLKEIF